MRKKINTKLIRSIKAPRRASIFICDPEFIGFGLRVSASGVRSFVLRYSLHGRERLYTIGHHPTWSAAAARKEASRLRRMVDVGKDPLTERNAPLKDRLFSDLADRYIKEHLPRKRPGSQKNDLSMLRKHLLPHFKNRCLRELSHQEFETLHATLSRTRPVTANRVLSLASKMFQLGRKWGWVDENPLSMVERNPEIARDRYLTEKQLQTLVTVLSTWPDKPSSHALLLLLLTGARRGEVLSARWKEFDLSAGIWQKPANSTKQRRSHRVPLSDHAKHILRKMEKEKGSVNEFLFPGLGATGHLVELKKQWRKILKAAELENLRIHDLRHCFASLLASQGCSLPIIGSLLGHTQTQTTARYAHLLDESLRTAANLAGAKLFPCFDTKDHLIERI
ncbi:MAG: tyrosine-type recombinase/integrase [Limibacillus sp.]